MVTLSQGKLDAGKTTAAFVGTDTDGFVFAGQVIKAGGTFSTADLAGRWQFNTFWDDPLANDAGMEHGTVIVDSSGAITGGDFFDDEGFPMAVSGGMLTINSAGIFSGTIEFFGGALIETISQGKLSGSKTVASYVGFDDAGFVFQGAALKIGDGINDFDDDGVSEVVVFRGGAWLFHDFTSGTQNSGIWTGSGAGCLPVAMDYDGDGKTDFTQFCNGAWHFYNATAATTKASGRAEWPEIGRCRQTMMATGKMTLSCTEEEPGSSITLPLVHLTRPRVGGPEEAGAVFQRRWITMGTGQRTSRSCVVERGIFTMTTAVTTRGSGRAE